MNDSILESARSLLEESLEELRESVDGLPVEALNWRPVDDANSIAIIATHALGAARLWFMMAMGLPLPNRDLDSEFHAAATDAEGFRRFVREMTDNCSDALRSADEVDWHAMRQTQGRAGGAPPEVSAAYALIHATEHLRGHVDQIGLMRTLWEGRNA